MRTAGTPTSSSNARGDPIVRLESFSRLVWPMKREVDWNPGATHAPSRLKHDLFRQAAVGNSGDFAVPNPNVPYYVESALRIHDASDRQSHNYSAKGLVRSPFDSIRNRDNILVTFMWASF